MAKPSNESVGTILVPEEDLLQWLQANYLKPPPGTFVTWAKVKLKNSNIEASYATSTVEPPPTPPEVATRPA